MKKIKVLLATAAAAFAFAGASAHADTVWNFAYTGAGLTASGQFDTLGDGSTPSLLQWMSGTYSDGTTTGAISLIPLNSAATPNTSTDGLYYYDNLFGGTPQIDNAGLLFFAGAQEINLYLDSGGMTSVTRYGGYVFTPVTFTATAVPEPGSLALLMAGLGALAFVSRRKARR